MMRKIKYVVALALFFAVQAVSAQNEVPMADVMRADGKIYVVVGVILIVLAGLIVYLFLLDKKVKNLENLLTEKQRQTK